MKVNFFVLGREGLLDSFDVEHLPVSRGDEVNIRDTIYIVAAIRWVVLADLVVVEVR